MVISGNKELRNEKVIIKRYNHYKLVRPTRKKVRNQIKLLILKFVMTLNIAGLEEVREIGESVFVTSMCSEALQKTLNK
jgi:hypothetical protein